MTIEWCEHDAMMRNFVVGEETIKAAVKVLVPDTKEDRATYTEWHKHQRTNVTGDGHGTVIVLGPDCPFRCWAETKDKGAKESVVHGDPIAVHQPGEVASISLIPA